MSIDVHSTNAESRVHEAALRAAGRIPPLWPLANTVAVNPFLGQAELDLAAASATLAKLAGASALMPRKWYAARLEAGDIAAVDLAAALSACRQKDRPASVAELIAALQQPQEANAPIAIPTVADLAAQVTGTDWPAIVEERIGAWAGSHFDAGQALWAQNPGRAAWASWRDWGRQDLAPEIHGLTGFCAIARDAPASGREAVAKASAALGLTPEAAASCFHQLLLSLGGWAQTGARLDFEAKLKGGSDETIIDLLAIRLTFEAVLLEVFGKTLAERWKAAIAAHASPAEPALDEIVRAIAQEALERANQRRLSELLASAPAPASAEERPAVQAAFCIDVRSEVFRRALETVDPSIRTLGFAGFFGIGTAHRGQASDTVEHRLPVLLSAGAFSRSGVPGDAKDEALRISERASRAWGRFKIAAVSSFAFVEAVGPVYLAKLAAGALGIGKRADAGPLPRFEPSTDAAGRTAIAANVLRAMSLTSGFAPLVLLAGHGAKVANNPFESGLHCGACGGHAGDVNARLLASVLNDPAVREGLAAQGIAVPADTWFVAALHETTTDEIVLYDEDAVPDSHRSRITKLRDWLARAGRIARAERMPRLPLAANQAQVAQRAVDWAQTRPEWGLAGCSAFIAAPRARTAGRSLQGRAFLHDYDWKADSARSFPVLELVLTAPVVVASWISLQYYGSVVAPSLLGSGNKLLHNVVGGVGVLEGNGGVLRAGLPWQSVHDGEKLTHDPLRLTVCVEAPREAITAILERHEGVRRLFDNGWLHLFALDDTGAMAWRYDGGLRWTTEPTAKVRLPVLGAAA